MSNINISFNNPWLLLLFIPAVALALFPYFRLKKKRRRTRNRVTSLVLHIVIILCSILVLSGFSMSKTEQVDSQIVVLVDRSESTNDVREEMDNYVGEIVDGTSNNSQIGIVAFGYGECAHTELKRPRELNVDNFVNSIDCNTSATDIENGINVATTLFDLESGAKKRIIILTDAIETDGDIVSLIDDLTNYEIEVDAIIFEPNDYTGTRELQVDNVEVPHEALPNETINISVSVSAHMASTAIINIYDNGNKVSLPSGKEVLNLKEGTQTFTFEHTVVEDGLHIIKVEVVSDEDLVIENNTFYSYCKVDGDQKILIIADGNQDTSKLVEQITDLGYGHVNKKPDEIGNMSAVDLSEYGEVIMMNVNASNLPKGFEDELETYVTNGGSLLTTGGENTYALGGWEGTKLEEMLPVEVVPKANNPRAIVICLDISNSMFMYTPDKTKLYDKPGPAEGREGTCIDVARKGIIEAVKNGLNPYDYLGIVVFGRNKEGVNDTEMILDLTPATNQNKIIEKVSAIKRKSSEGSTNYDEALVICKNMLDTFTGDVNHKSVVLINDDDGDNDDCKTYADTISAMVNPAQEKDKIDFSTIVVSKSISENMSTIGGIIGMENVHQVQTAEGFTSVIFDLCKSLPSSEYNYVNGVITDLSVEKGSPITKGFDTFPEIEEYNGVSAKSSTSVQVPIEYHNTNTVQDINGEYVQLDNHDPIYAQWDYGEGKVGACMIDFSGVACPQMYVKDEGITFVRNVITTLFSKNDITSKLGVDFLSKNYTTEMTVSLSSSEGTVTSATAKVKVPNESGYTDLDSFVQVGNDFDGELETMKAGVYEIEVTKTVEKTVDGQVVTTTSTNTVYTTFSYSSEYNTFYNVKESLAVLSKVADETGGTVYFSADDITQNIAEMSQSIIDLKPQVWLMILALILFLLDICVRKFNFLWPHEIYNKYKEKRAK